MNLEVSSIITKFGGKYAMTKSSKKRNRRLLMQKKRDGTDR